LLPLSAGGRYHTSAVLFAAIFHFLIVDCILPLPQLFAPAAAAAATTAMFVGLLTRPQRWESARDALFANQTMLSMSLSLMSLSS
jgi:hypothetical protein